MNHKRNRLVYGFATFIVMFLGLCSRKLKYFIPDFLNVYLGDTLWALMIFMLFAFIFKGTKTKMVALMALAFCYLIEISQLYHSNWIDNIRKTTLGGLVLGYVFSWKDLLAYAIGIGIGIIVEGVFYYSNNYGVK
ncbi:DUF2809 domain-containing protein [Clostridium botulinum]|uniref:DUF2809 domain-containing protein n=1 Tax=Clostridium botulinum (strain Langeland / NCTC 10281 / Type F) TaxID=441772 RepID=A7GFI2_CLOBL|nr:DUF2809 domain-containing protein [Clostridium botulinum]ABS40708.1 conserved hypothetical protein [Clostridium botulinum F str. Langeland]ADF99945.1 conserved hypothetical protein [Clostridium botulinum F str. 230613]KKM42486.1 hypothetical protein VT72_02275 [Clostridium botulinum]MBY6793026.1 DUF2809 domain-containing protein [Clostridium botulinum]MBY6937236.1 DUF2809 domain-containing protein [Clostridium botulinum]